jgi:hypothetical protein
MPTRHVVAINSRVDLLLACSNLCAAKSSSSYEKKPIKAILRQKKHEKESIFQKAFLQKHDYESISQKARKKQGAKKNNQILPASPLSHTVVLSTLPFFNLCNY